MMRHAPVVQRPIEDLAAYVPRDAFAGVMALIVGGSRGLGEVAGKLVAAGGGLPILTYANDAGKAAAVAQEIEAWGSPCHIMRLDMEADLAPQLAALPAVPDWLLYFATPMIAARRGAPFDAAKLHRFLHFYATAFRDLVHALPCGERGLRALYPSSVFVAEPPPGLAEYAMAKAAGEILCRDMVARRQGFRAEILRLPPLATDQNPHLANIDSAVPLLLDGLRALG
jgi:NAD(P)-dependent dehydrogenase (short-subunit alcohol dehydrogenase family)